MEKRIIVKLFCCEKSVFVHRSVILQSILEHLILSKVSLFKK